MGNEGMKFKAMQGEAGVGRLKEGVQARVHKDFE